jgi:hypothetical protein
MMGECIAGFLYTKFFFLAAKPLGVYVPAPEYLEKPLKKTKFLPNL